MKKFNEWINEENEPPIDTGIYDRWNATPCPPELPEEIDSLTQQIALLINGYRKLNNSARIGKIYQIKKLVQSLNLIVQELHHKELEPIRKDMEKDPYERK